MRSFVNDHWDDFNKDLPGRELILFGWNSACRLLRESVKYGEPWDVDLVLDNDARKHGIKWIDGYHQEIQVVSPEILRNKRDEKTVVLICGSYITEMALQLESLGIHHYYSEFWLSRPEELRVTGRQDISSEIIGEMKSLVNDDESRRIIDSIAEKRRDGIIDYTDIMQRGSEYFIDEFWRPSPDEVFVDGGAYNGDTIEEFIDWTKGAFRHIYSFEPQADLAAAIESKLWKYSGKVTLIPKGLWSSEKTLRFDKGTETVSGRINGILPELDQGKEINTISTTTLDGVLGEEHVTFIKMDIEGAEMEAIRGADGIIRRDRPKLAISIYHLPNDFWEIPFLIHNLVPEYKLYIRHCGFGIFGTVLYAKV